MGLYYNTTGEPVEIMHIVRNKAQVGYSTVGSPAIVNGIYTKTADDSTNRVIIKDTVTWPQATNVEFIIKFKHTGDFSRQNLFRRQRWFHLNVESSGTLRLLKYYTSSDYYTITGNTVLENDTWYWVKVVYNTSSTTMYLSTDGVTYTQEATGSSSSYYSDRNYTALIGSYAMPGESGDGSYNFAGQIDLNETYMKLNNSLWFWGTDTNYLIKDGKLIWADSGLYIEENGVKTYATQNLAPVPSGFTFGNTTTSDVGLVDMTTQTFTAHPGATWGKEE